MLEPLIRGRPRLLSPDEQRLLAFWATKTVLAFQTIEHETTRFADRALYGQLHRLQAPPPDTQVWLGANLHGHPAWHRSHSIVPREESSNGCCFGATLTVGHVVFHIVSLPGVEGRLYLRRDPDLALRDIWPDAARTLAWPPSVILREHDLTALAEVIAQTSVLRADRAA